MLHKVEHRFGFLKTVYYALRGTPISSRIRSVYQIQYMYCVLIGEMHHGPPSFFDIFPWFIYRFWKEERVLILVGFLFYFLNSIRVKPNFSEDVTEKKHLLKVTAEHFLCPAFPSYPVSCVRPIWPVSMQYARRLAGLLATKLTSQQIFHLQKLDDGGC